MNEEWRPVKGYEGIYTVSNLGRIKRLERTIKARSGNYRRLKEMIKTPVVVRGYRMILLICNGNAKNKKVARLVAETFIENPDNKPIINHIDGNKTNDTVENLQWCTSKENSEHSVKMGLHNIGQRHKNAKLTDEQVMKIKELRIIHSWENRKIAKLFQVDPDTVTGILGGKTWRHLLDKNPDGTLIKPLDEINPKPEPDDFVKSQIRKIVETTLKYLRGEISEKKRESIYDEVYLNLKKL